MTLAKPGITRLSLAWWFSSHGGGYLGWGIRKRRRCQQCVWDPWSNSENCIFTLKSKANCPTYLSAGSRSFGKIIKLSDIWEQREELALDLSVFFTVSLTSILNSSRITCEFTSSVTLRWCRLAQAVFLNWRNYLHFFAKDSSGN